MSKKHTACKSAAAGGRWEDDDEDSHDSHDEECCQEKSVTEFLTQLPLPHRRRVYALKANHTKLREIRARYDTELKALDLKYEAMSHALFEIRKKIVTGEVEPTKEQIAAGEEHAKSTSKVEEVVSSEGEEKDADDVNNKPRRGVAAGKKSATATAAVKEAPPHAAEKGTSSSPPATDAKGIPDFWMRALLHHEVTGDSITERDEEALHFLQNITCSYLNKDPFLGYTLTFEFAENPYFKNTLLTKTYHLEREYDESVLVRTEGCPIEWHSKTMNLTVEIKKKTQKHKTKKTVRTIEKEVKCDSFFNFFSPPRIPQDEDEEKEDEEKEDDEDVDYEELEEQIEYDYDSGNSIKDEIIPRAVDFYLAQGHSHSFGDMLAGGKGKDIMGKKNAECNQQ